MSSVTAPPSETDAGGNVAAPQLVVGAACSGTDGSGGSPRARTAPFIIGVSGGTASGKTSVCSKIIEALMQDELGHAVILSLPQDCFYRDLSPEQAANIGSVNFDHPDAYDVQEMLDCLAALRSGRPADVPTYDFVTSARRPGEFTRVAVADVILVDGILAFWWPELRELFDLKIFVDCDADTRLARRLRRDIVERGRDVLAVLDQYEATVKPSFEGFILPCKKYADIIVPRGGDNHVAIDLIIQLIRLKLRAKEQPRQQPSSSSRAIAGSSQQQPSSSQQQLGNSQQWLSSQRQSSPNQQAVAAAPAAAQAPPICAGSSTGS